MLCWFGSRCFSAVSSWGVGWRMLSSSPVSPALSLLACGPHFCAMIAMFLHLLHSSLLSGVCIDPGALPLIYSAFLHGFLCWVSSSPILTTGHVSVYVRFLLILEGKVYGRVLYFLTCRELYMYCVWSLIEVFGLPFEWFSVDVKKVASCNSVSKLFCMQLCMCMWFCVWWCEVHDASCHRGHTDKHIFTNYHSRLIWIRFCATKTDSPQVGRWKL